jgi:2-polyprenyl-3-methyl-5-hydroxy-6-metoxy-1,4-benzoquinol methylase
VRGTGKSFLLVPAGGGGEGMGHLNRCLLLARQLGGPTAFLTRFMDEAARVILAGQLAAWKTRPRPRALEAPPAGRTWGLVVVDKRGTSARELASFERLGPTVLLDEGGSARGTAPFLIDTLPGPRGRSPGNVASPRLLALPPRRRKSFPQLRRALVSFGGEDSQGLSGKLVTCLIDGGHFPASRITVVQGALFGERRWPRGVLVRGHAEGLADELWKYDIVFTHFGITAFEALASGVPVVLFNPSRYHGSLGKIAGIPDIGVGTPREGRLRALLRDPRALRDSVEELNRRIGKERPAELARLLLSLDPKGFSRCPVCGRAPGRAIARFPDRTFRRCACCGVVHAQDFARRGDRYGREYFFSEYRAQYGRTYLEDFQNIRALCVPRARVVGGLLRRGLTGAPVRAPEGAIVDVGCAYGAFLDALRAEGLKGFGVDVSADAVRYVRRVLGIPAARGPFESIPREALPRRIAGVALWYVLEHFTDVDRVLRRVGALLGPGGVLAFSTPNARGISARADLVAFLRASPADHFTVFSPRGLRALLARYGFSLKLVRVTGHHPERFSGFLGRLGRGDGMARRALLLASRLFGLGDTFEAYAVKARSR